MKAKTDRQERATACFKETIKTLRNDKVLLELKNQKTYIDEAIAVRLQELKTQTRQKWGF
jgi:hypothetical protein